MNKIILLILLGVIGWVGYDKYEQYRPQAGISAIDKSEVSLSSVIKESSASNFKCDGRTHCSQMTSCEEASYFLKHCPGTKMDGNHDGIPCEKQWCN